MKKIVVSAIALACLLGLSANSESALAKGTSKSNSSNKGKLIAEKKSDLPKVMDFYTTWCGPCKRLAPILEEIEKSYKEKVDFQRLDCEAAENKETVDKYNIEAYPTVVFLDKNGKEVSRIVGLPSKEELVKRVDNLLK